MLATESSPHSAFVVIKWERSTDRGNLNSSLPMQQKPTGCKGSLLKAMRGLCSEGFFPASSRDGTSLVVLTPGRQAHRCLLLICPHQVAFHRITCSWWLLGLAASTVYHSDCSVM